MHFPQLVVSLEVTSTEEHFWYTMLANCSWQANKVWQGWNLLNMAGKSTLVHYCLPSAWNVCHSYTTICKCACKCETRRCGRHSAGVIFCHGKPDMTCKNVNSNWLLFSCNFEFSLNLWHQLFWRCNLRSVYAKYQQNSVSGVSILVNVIGCLSCECRFTSVV